MADNVFQDNQGSDNIGTSVTLGNNNTFPQQDDPWAFRSLSDSQKTVLAVLPIPSAILSIIGSSLIIYMAYLSKKSKPWTPYNRLLVAMSVYDIITSMTLGAAPFLNPKETSNKALALGNDSTCSAIGFLIQVGNLIVVCVGLGVMATFVDSDFFFFVPSDIVLWNLVQCGVELLFLIDCSFWNTEQCSRQVYRAIHAYIQCRLADDHCLCGSFSGSICRTGGGTWMLGKSVSDRVCCFRCSLSALHIRIPLMVHHVIYLYSYPKKCGYGPDGTGEPCLSSMVSWVFGGKCNNRFNTTLCVVLSELEQSCKFLTFVFSQDGLELAL